MKTLARHLTANFFNCKNSKLQDIDAILSALRDVSEHLRFTLVDSITHQLSEDHYAIMMLFHEGHLTLHVYTSLKYVALDVFLCQENACPDDVAHSMREFFKPDKIRSTLLKRGDYTEKAFLIFTSAQTASLIAFLIALFCFIFLPFYGKKRAVNSVAENKKIKAEHDAKK